MRLKYILSTAVAALVIAGPTNSAQADAGVSFAYQGRVKVQGQPHNGSGLFKFAIVDTSGTTTLWSHDATGTNGSEPTGSVSLNVQDGIFNVIIGDPAAGMQAINPVVFRGQTPPRLRVWFNDGTRGFQQLLPDHTIVNPEIISYATADEDFTIYVRHSDGNDSDNGLTTASAKRTIQAAVDTLPERVKCNVTISIEPGTYREEVMIYGITVPQGKKLLLEGDTTWTHAAGGTPSVRITGLSASSVRERQSAMRCLQSARIYFKGLALDGTSDFGFNSESSTCELENCHVSDTLNNGMILGINSRVTLTGCVVQDCQGSGFRVGPQCVVLMNDCRARRNSFAGLLGSGQAEISITGYCEFEDNADSQIWLSSSNLNLHTPVKLINTHGSIAKRGVSNAWMSMVSGYSNLQYQGLVSPQFYESRGATHWD